MPSVEVRAFRDETGRVPLLEWLEDLAKRAPRAFAKCVQRILYLAEQGNALRRPYAEMLRDGIYELRTESGNVQYRILYFFAGRRAVVVSHGLVKKGRMDPREIEVAIQRKALVARDADRFSADFEV